MIPLPYTLLGALALAIAAWFGGDHVGHTRGVNAQKVADQAEFDRVNADLTAQKAQANAVYRKFQENNLALVIERDQFKTNLEKQREENRLATNARRDEYAGLGLRYSAPQGAGRRLGSGTTPGAGADPASAPPAPVLQLPDPIAAALRRLTYDADDLADNYRKCYEFAVKAK